MSEDHNRKISDLYRQSSQETPPAHLDRAVMDRARKSVRRRLFAPFGDNWVAHGAVMGVIILSVLLLLDVPQQPDDYTSARDAVAPSSEVLPEIFTETRNEAAGKRALPSGITSGAEEKREVPAAPKARFDVHEEMQDMELIVPEEEIRMRMMQAPAPAAEEPASLASTIPAGPYYLQAGSFHDKARAAELRTRLTELGFKCEIREVTINNTDIDHRVRVGPIPDLETLDTTRQKLDELGIETRMVKDRQ